MYSSHLKAVSENCNALSLYFHVSMLQTFKKILPLFSFLCCVPRHQPFNLDIQQLENDTAEITPCFCLDLSLITPAFSHPAPTYIPCGDSHLSQLTPGMPPWSNRQLFVLGGGVKPLSRLLLIGLRRLLLSGSS